MTVHLLVERLRRDHSIDDFDCGQPPLNLFLGRYALIGQQSDGSVTYLALNDTKVIGYYTLVFGSIEHSEASLRLKKGLAHYPVPLMVLARLAVHRAWQKRGIGSGLLRDAMRRTAQASEIGGLRAFVAHAKDEAAAAFYLHFGFVPSPTDPLHMFMLLKDVRRMLNA